jgi:predicted  nucleic acid-binding Zn-ribbon protein
MRILWVYRSVQKLLRRRSNRARDVVGNTTSASETEITAGASQQATDRRETKTDEAQNVQNRWEHST